MPLTRPSWIPAWATSKNALIVGLVITVIYLGWVSWFTPKPVDVAELTKKIRADVTKEFAAEVMNNKKIAKDQDDKIKGYKAQIKVSGDKVITLDKRIKEMIDAQANRVPPKTNEDIRKRLTAFGIRTF